MSNEVKKITLGLVINWAFGILFGLSSIALIIGGSLVDGIILLLISIILFPPANRLMKNKYNFELSRGLKIALTVILLIIFFAQTPETETHSSKQIVSNSFSNDYGHFVLCDVPRSTEVQKEKLLADIARNFTGKYVNWTLPVFDVVEFEGDYALEIFYEEYYCKNSDYDQYASLKIAMNTNQRKILMDLKPGDQVTFIAKLKYFSKTSGEPQLSDGEIVAVTKKEQ